jgi:uncharacterized protein YqgC (DUF456 family)
MMSVTILIILTILLMLFGLAGTILPFLPGIPLIYLGYIVFGLASHWDYYGLPAMVFWGIITLITVFLDYYASALGAKKLGASNYGIWGSILGGILGIIFLGFPGLIIGPFLGAVVAELLIGKTKKEAWKSGWGTFMGFLAGSLFKVVLGVVMISSFLWLVLF